MDGAELLKVLSSLGSTGIVIYLMLAYNKKEADRDKLYLDRLDRIENRHLEEEKNDREQVRTIFEQVRALFDRVITICNELSVAVKELSQSTKANERAINELRDEFRKLSKS